MTPNRRGVAVPTGDPDFASVVLLLDFAGADQATNFTDLSNSAHVETFVGGAKINTGNPFLGVNVLRLDDPPNDYVHFPDSDDWDFGTGDFTVECGVKFNVTNTIQSFISHYDGIATDGIFFQLRGNVNELRFGWAPAHIIASSWTPSTSTWYHVAACRSGTDIRLFVDGTQIGSTVTDSTNMTGGIKKMFLGTLRDDSVIQVMDGFIGAVRITKGVARYTANFTELTEFYPTS